MWYNAGSDCGVKIIYLCRMGGNMNIQIFGTKKNFDSKKACLLYTSWFGVGVAMFSIPTAELLGINKWVLTIVAGLLNPFIDSQ